MKPVDFTEVDLKDIFVNVNHQTKLAYEKTVFTILDYCSISNG